MTVSEPIESCVKELREHYNEDWDSTVPGAEFDAEMRRILHRHLGQGTRAEPSRGAPEADLESRIEQAIRHVYPDLSNLPTLMRVVAEAHAKSRHVVLLEALRRCVAVMNEVELHEGKKFFTYTKREASAAIQKAERT